MPKARSALAVCVLALSLGGHPAGAAAPRAAKGPVGWDVYRRLDLLPRIRTGERTRQVSSYDRTGGNDDGFSGAYSCLRLVTDGCLIAEHRGPGEVESIWFTHSLPGDVSATGAIRVRLDGRTVLDAPLQDVVAGRLGSPFAFPLVADWTRSLGGNQIKVPMPFRHSMRIATEHNPRFYHVTYRAFRDARGVPAFDPRRRVPDVLATLRAAGRADPKRTLGRRAVVAASFRIPARRRVVLARMKGPALVTALRIRLRRAGADPAGVLKEARLRIAFDGHRTVDAPLGEFFGSGHGPALVRSLMFAMGPRAGDPLTAWWPMPFARSAVIELDNRSSAAIAAGDVRLTLVPSPRWGRELRRGRAGYFHATSRRGPTTAGRDWLFVRARGPGTFAGVTQTMEGPFSPRYLEGDERAVVDGRLQIHGTGTEDFYEGGWYFLLQPFTLPQNGLPAFLRPADGCPAPSCATMYRLMLGDAVPFGSSLRFGIEHGPANDVDAVYGSTAYWYGARGRSTARRR